MINEPAHVHLTHRTLNIKQNPVDPTQLLLVAVLVAATSLPSEEVERVKERIIREGIRVYITGSVESEMVAAMRMALLRTEAERDQNRTRADYFESELAKANNRISMLEDELKDKRRSLSFLEEGLRGSLWNS